MFDFSRAHRLASQSDFQFVFAKPYKVSRKYLLALYRPNQRSDVRLGIIIKKQLVSCAVDRNRLRRVIRESFRNHQEKLKGLDIIVLMRSQCTPVIHSAFKGSQADLKRGKKVLRDDIDQIWPQLVIP